MNSGSNETPPEPFSVVDERQLVRIEAVHRGFLYQHLYAVACLLLAGTAAVQRIVVERDEDIEVQLPDARIYAQIKTRNDLLQPSDIAGTLERFADLRAEHENGKRPGTARFVIATNATPSASLLKAIEAQDWPADVELHWPAGPEPKDQCLPRPADDIAGMIGLGSELADKLPFALLRPETLTWKLASLVMFAAAGSPPRDDHSFSRDELPDLFDQLVVQMQELPAPPPVYRAQVDEPALLGEQPARIISGLSGSGKTAWVAESALHAPLPVTYLDVGDTPGPALASALAREVAARMFGRSGDALGEILLPGSSGLEMVGALSIKLGEGGLHADVVIDNCHRVPASDLIAIVKRAPNLRFVLLGQPGPDISALEAGLNIRAETLGGWDEDTIAAAVHDAGCRLDFSDCERLSRITGGLPFYVLNAATIAAREYGGSIRAFCDDIESQTHIVETAQEIILRRAFEGLPAEDRETIAILSLADVALSRNDAIDLLRSACGIDAGAAAAKLRSLPSTGALEIFGNAGLKIHDAVRMLGKASLTARGAEFETSAFTALQRVIIASIRTDWSLAKFGLLIRLFGLLGDGRILVQFATDELFHELGVWPEIEPFLLAIASDPHGDPETRLWALDGLVFNDLREGQFDAAKSRIDEMEALLGAHGLGEDEWLAWGMKRMLLMSEQGDRDGVVSMLDEVEKRLPDKPEHLRIFRYNRALALFKLGDRDAAVSEASALIAEYYAELGLTPDDVIGRNAPELRRLLPQGEDITDTLKHIADSHDLLAQAIGRRSPRSNLARIHAMKFYELSQSYQSFVRVGLDLVDELVWVNDFIAARETLERNIFPVLQGAGLAGRVLEARALYAVVLAYCGDHQAAENEVARLLPFEDAMEPNHRRAFQEQKAIIRRVRLQGGPPQRRVDIPAALQALFDQRRGAHRSVEPRKKVGRNEHCPCGSGRKFKLCHGR
ncbi:MAG: SEC-C metal-binding domain-containing protein [Sphingopyxis sp.]|uniref:SEC-C metal-binding domain-containing protein n=1 Tax=Sphingopyxis sp. TaxID=1908224 RepID=UPI002AB9203B|nr:SEC-C metal-binding domain-containing protein [Sphingopyxis sp.]MDZ3831939.1 SEC-C metal-binding domain-containing protein [Sphingopyxis sp.]